MRVLKAAVFARLKGFAGLVSLLPAASSVYNKRARQGAAFPYVIVQEMAQTDDNKSPRRAKQFLYLVKGVSDEPMSGEADAINEQIDAALHGVTLSVTGWSNFQSRRESSVEYVEDVPGGGSLEHIGGIYRLRIAQ